MSSADSATPYGYSDASAKATGSGRSGLAMAALIVAIVAVLISVGASITHLGLIGSNLTAVQLAAAISTIANLSAAVIALAALVLGILAVRGARPAVAGAAIGMSAAHVFGTAVSMLAPLVLL